MGVHPHLLPAVVGAGAGLPLLLLGGVRYLRRWSARSRGQRARVGLLLAAFALGYALNVYAWLIEPRRLVVRPVDVATERWRGAPLTVAVLSDVHVGSAHVDAARVSRVVDRVNALRPDLVVLLGDYAGSHEPEELRADAARSEILGGLSAFARFTAPLGVVAVLGNHDIWYGSASIERALRAAGVTVLWNQHVVKVRPGGDVVVGGISDSDLGHPDFVATLAGAPAADTIVLSHSPDPFPRLPAGPALMLAGHSHCGQVSVPFLGRPIVPLRTGERYACGRVDERGRTLYTTAGLGTSILPVRFGNPPEIVLLTLHGAAAPR